MHLHTFQFNRLYLTDERILYFEIFLQSLFSDITFLMHFSVLNPDDVSITNLKWDIINYLGEWISILHFQIKILCKVQFVISNWDALQCSKMVIFEIKVQNDVTIHQVSVSRLSPLEGILHLKISLLSSICDLQFQVF